MADLRLMSGDSLARKHVVFIHGLGGNAETTWQSNGSEKVFWPKWLHEDIEDICIWSIGYEAPKLTVRDSGMGLLDRAQNVLETLLAEQQLSKGELILVGHSLGGLIIKQLLRLASDQNGREGAIELINRVTSVAFLGTPHTGADLAQTGNYLLVQLVLKLFLHRPSPATASLERNDATLRDLNTWYRGWCHDKDIRHLVLVETKPYLIFGRIVKADSSDPGLKDRAIPIDAHHINISKPSSRQDDIYKHIKSFVAEYSLSKQASWLRANFGRDYSGWEEYGNWAKCPKGIEEEYILDQAVRLHSSSSNDTEGLATLDALNLLRNRLLKAGTSIRLVGLSGVGKTRFVQALFDDRIGVNALDKESVFYSDISLSPSPTPRVLVERPYFQSVNIPISVAIDSARQFRRVELPQKNQQDQSALIRLIETKTEQLNLLGDAINRLDELKTQLEKVNTAGIDLSITEFMDYQEKVQRNIGCKELQTNELQKEIDDLCKHLLWRYFSILPGDWLYSDEGRFKRVPTQVVYESASYQDGFIFVSGRNITQKSEIGKRYDSILIRLKNDEHIE